MPQPSLGYGKPTEATIDQVNTWMRSTPWYQQQLRAWGQDPGHPTLTKAQSQYLLHQAQANGVVVDEGDMEVDNHGNFNPKGHKLRNTLIVAGIAGATIATMGAAGVFSGAAAGGAAGSAGAVAPEIGIASTAAGTMATPGVVAAGMGSTAAAGTAAGVGGTAATLAPRVATAARFGLNANTAFTAGTQLFGNLYGAWMQGRAADKAAQAETAAAKYAADLQSKSTADALAFQRSQAENAFQNNEVSRRGNYDMYAARERRLGFLGDELGFPSREIPAYVPGVDPRYTGDGTIGAVANGPTSAPPDLSGVQAKFNELFPGETLTPEMLAAKRPELEALGFKLNPNARGQITDLSYGGVNIDPIEGAGSGLNKKQWLVNLPGSGGGGSAAPARAAMAPYVAPVVPFLNATQPAPALGYLGSY